MEFDEATGDVDKSPSSMDSADLSADNTNFAVAKRQFEDAGYSLPRIVFWNLAE